MVKQYYKKVLMRQSANLKSNLSPDGVLQDLLTASALGPDTFDKIKLIKANAIDSQKVGALLDTLHTESEDAYVVFMRSLKKHRSDLWKDVKKTEEEEKEKEEAEGKGDSVSVTPPALMQVIDMLEIVQAAELITPMGHLDRLKIYGKLGITKEMINSGETEAPAPKDQAYYVLTKWQEANPQTATKAKIVEALKKVGKVQQAQVLSGNYN